jgi:eukaryotic-like serine/threonine-protein kinase
MSVDSNDPSSLPDPLEPILESFLIRVRRGERPSIKDYADRYPAQAVDIHGLLPPLVEMELAAQARGQRSPSILEAVTSLRAAGGRVAGSRGSDESGETDLKQLGDYKILSKIGGGGMGIVYEAERVTLRSRVALKVIRPKYRGRDDYVLSFLDEARAAASLHHTNIVTVFDYGQHEGIPFYAMQFIAGHSLDKVLVDVKRLEREAATGALAENGLDETLGPTRSLERSPGPVLDVDLRTVSIGLLRGQFDSTPPAATAAAFLREAGATVSRPAAAEEGDRPTGYSGLGAATGSSRSGAAFLRYQREIARIGAQVADALDYAHKRKVIHRDIKPHNILLDALGNPWITDFGLAKLRRTEEASDPLAFAGTLRYMSPERFHGNSDGRDDIYALGATLYELLALRPVFDDRNALGLIHKIENEPPVPIRKVDRRIHPDLAAIIAKTLAKDPADRYQAAGEMRDDLRRFIEGRPVGPRPRPFHSRFWLWCRRNPWLAAASIAAAVMTTALAIGATVVAKVVYDRQVQIAAVNKDLKETAKVLYERQLQIAAVNKDLEKSETKALEKLFEAKASEARASRFSGQVGQRFESLAALSEAVEIGHELGYPAYRFDRLRDQAIASLMLPDLKPAGPSIPLPGAISRFAFDAGMTRYALRKIDGTILVRHFGDNREIARIPAKGDRDIWLLTFSPNGKYLTSRDGNTISVWDVDRNTLVWTLPGHCKNYAASFSPDGRRLALAPNDDNGILVYDLVTGQSRQWGEPKRICSLAYRPDGREIAVCCSDDRKAICRILDAETGRERLTFPVPGVGPVAWSPDGSTLAIAAGGQENCVFNASRGDRATTPRGPVTIRHTTDIAFHPAGTLLASNGWEGRLRLLDWASGQERLSLMCGGVPAFREDGAICVQIGNQLKPLEINSAVEFTTLTYPSTRLLTYARSSIHRDGRLVSVGTDHGVILWDLARKTELGFLPIGMAWHSAFEPSGDLLTNGQQAGVLRWPIRSDPTSGEIRIGPPRNLSLRGTPCGIDADRSGQIIAVADYHEVQVRLGSQTIKIEPLDDCRTVSVSPDGKWLATNDNWNGGVSIRSLPDLSLVKRLPFEGGAESKFSPDGRWLVAGQGFSHSLLEVGSWREVRPIEGNFRNFSPDSKLGIVEDESNILKLIEIQTGRVLARLERPDPQREKWVAFSPDCSRLVTTTDEPPSARVIDLRAIRRGLAELGLDWDAPAFPEADPASRDLPPLPPIKIDYGFLRPDAVLTQLLAGLNHNDPRTEEPAIPALETALAADPSNTDFKHSLALCCNNVAWFLAKGSPSSSDLERALTLSRRAVELEPGNQAYLNTRGVILYRAGQYADAVSILDKSLEAGKGQYDGFDLFFLAMAHHHLGHRDEARRCLNRAIAWVSRATSLSDQSVKELADFRAEAEAVLAGPIGELPDDVFERPKAKDRPSP